MGCHPSHWRTPSFFKMVIAPPTSQTFFFSISYMGIIISDLHIFQRSWSTTNQYTYSHNQVYNGNVSIQNGHLQLIYPLKTVIFHSLSTKTPPKTLPKRWTSSGPGEMRKSSNRCGRRFRTRRRTAVSTSEVWWLVQHVEIYIIFDTYIYIYIQIYNHNVYTDIYIYIQNYIYNYDIILWYYVYI